MKIQTLTSEKMYAGRAFNVRRDLVKLPNGKTTRLDIVDHSGAVTILPVDDQGFIWFVSQYRHPTGGEILELPAGTLEEGEDPLVCAQREIQEEIGMGSRDLKKIGEFFLTPGYSTEYMYIYLARDLYPSSLPQDADEILDPVQLHLDEAKAKIASGEIKDAKTIASLYLAQDFL